MMVGIAKLRTISTKREQCQNMDQAYYIDW
jgi:hypothetical protein